MRQVIVSAVLLAGLALSGCAVSVAAPPPTPTATTTSASASAATPSTDPSRSPTPTPSPTPSRDSGPLSVVGIGDSVMAGTHCDCAGPMAAYADLLARSTGRRVSQRSFGVNGGTTASVLTQTDSDPVRGALQQADVVVVIIGANDLTPDEQKFSASSCNAACYQPDVNAMGDRLGQLLDRVAALGASRHPVVLVTGYWDLFAEAGLSRSGPDSEQLRWQETITDAANVAIKREALSHGDVYVDLVAPFRGPDGQDDPTGLLASDGDHPSAAGVQVLAKALVAARPTMP